MFEFEMAPMFLSLVPVTVAVVSLLKGYIGSYWSPLVSLVVGYGLAQIVTDMSLVETMIPGLTVGLMAAGAYSGVKSMVQ